MMKKMMTLNSNNFIKWMYQLGTSSFCINVDSMKKNAYTLLFQPSILVSHSSFFVVIRLTN